MLSFIQKFFNQRHFNTNAQSAFSNYYRFASESPAMKKYCHEVHGIDIFMHNNLSKAQFEKVFKLIKNKKSLLDIGCGSGELTNYIAEVFNISTFGIDHSVKQSLVGKSFKRVNYETASLGENRFDIAISLDGFYMLNNIETTLLKVLKSLKKDSSFIITYTSPKLFEKTKLSQVISKLKLESEVLDFTSDDLEFNKNAEKVLSSLEDDFYKEGNINIFKTKKKEITNNLAAHQSNSMKRYICVIKN